MGAVVGGFRGGGAFETAPSPALSPGGRAELLELEGVGVVCGGVVLAADALLVAAPAELASCPVALAFAALSEVATSHSRTVWSAEADAICRHRHVCRGAGKLMTWVVQLVGLSTWHAGGGGRPVQLIGMMTGEAGQAEVISEH